MSSSAYTLLHRIENLDHEVLALDISSSGDYLGVGSQNSSFSLKVVMLTKTTARTSFEVYSLITFEREYKFVDRHRGMISHIRFCTRPEDPFETVVYTTGLGYFVIMVGNMDGEWHGMKKEEIDVTTINSSMVFQHLLLFEVRMERAICVSHSGW